MTAPTGGYVLKDTTCTFDGTDFANQLTKILLKPETPTQTMRTLVPDGIVQDVDSAAWVLEVTGLQDATVGGFAKYCNDNAGDTVTVIYTPKPGGTVATFDVVLKSVPFGGEQGSFAAIEVELPVVGQPVFV